MKSFVIIPKSEGFSVSGDCLVKSAHPGEFDAEVVVSVGAPLAEMEVFPVEWDVRKTLVQMDVV